MPIIETDVSPERRDVFASATNRQTNRQGTRSDVRTRILDVLRKKPECELEELVRVCSAFTWNQVFLEVDRLSRTGELRLVPRRAGVYAVRLSAA